MEIKLPEIQATLDILKNDSQTMENPQVRTAVQQLDEMLSKLELRQTLIPSDNTLATPPDISVLEQLTDLIPQIFKDVSQREPLLQLLSRLGMMYRGLGEPERTRHLCERILELTADGEFPRIRADAFRELGNLKFYEGQGHHAKTFYQKSLALYEAEKNLGHVAVIYNNLGYIAAQRGEYDLAKKYHRQAIEIAAQKKDYRRLSAGAYNSLGIIASVQADWEAAVNYFERSITIYEEIDLPREASGVYTNLAMVYVDAEEWEAAGECYAEATTLAEKSGNLITLSGIYVNRAEFLLNIGNIDAAQVYCNKALAIFQKISDTIGIAEVYKLYGRIHRHQKAWDDAVKAFTQSLQFYQSCQNIQGEAEGCYEFGLMFKERQDVPQALYFLQRSHTLYGQLGAVDEIKRVSAALEALAA